MCVCVCVCIHSAILLSFIHAQTRLLFFFFFLGVRLCKAITRIGKRCRGAVLLTIFLDSYRFVALRKYGSPYLLTRSHVLIDACDCTYGCMDIVRRYRRERKIPCRTVSSNPRQEFQLDAVRRTPYQLSYPCPYY